MPDTPRVPKLFLSYARADDKADAGAISALRQGLMEAHKVVTGYPLAIFQDREDIEWGQHWPDTLEKALDESVFLIPIMTPSYFESDQCRMELEKFIRYETKLGRRDLILPVYWRTAARLSEDEHRRADDLALILRDRQYRDWRELRSRPPNDPDVKHAREELAHAISRAFLRASLIFPSADKATTIAAPHTPHTAQSPNSHGRDTTRTTTVISSTTRTTTVISSDSGGLSLDALWENDKARQYLARLLLAVSHGRKTATGIMRGISWSDIKAGISAAGFEGDGQNIRNFAMRVIDKSSGGTRFYNAAADYLVGLFDTDASWNTSRGIKEISDEWDILRLYQHVAGKKPLPYHDYKILRRPIDASPYQSLAGAIQLIFDVDLNEANDCILKYLKKTDNTYVDTCFLCYRYSTTPGRIVKSFLTVMAPLQGALPLSRFDLHYKNADGGRRLVKGYAIPLRCAIYFLGNVDQGSGVYMIVLPRAGREQVLFRGLTLSMNSAYEPLVSRVVVRRARALAPEDVRIHVFDESNIEQEINHDRQHEWEQPSDDLWNDIRLLRKYMRNAVSSELIDHIFNKDDELIDQDQVRQVVASALNPGGHAILKRRELGQPSERRKPYNPIADGGLPFNSAIRAWAKK